MTEKQTALITGMLGVFGSAFFLELLKSNHQVIPSDFLPKDKALDIFAKKYPHETAALKHLNQHYQEIDVNKITPQKIRGLDQKYGGFTQVYHMPAVLSAQSRNNPQLAWQINFLAAQKFMDTFAQISSKQKRDIAFVHNSSIARDSIGFLGDELAWAVASQDFSPAPIVRMYGEAKIMLERNGRVQMGLHQRFTAVQAIVPGIVPGTLYNPPVNPDTGSTEWLHYAIHEATKLQQGNTLHVKIPVDPDVTMPIISLDDAVRIIMAAASNKDLRNRMDVSGFPLGAMHVSPREAMEKLEAVLKAQDKKLVVDWLVNDPRNINVSSWRRSVDASKVFEIIGVKPEHEHFGTYLLAMLDSQQLIVEHENIARVTPSELKHDLILQLRQLERQRLGALSQLRSCGV